MGILNIQIGFTGLAGVKPNLDFILTNDTVATITTAGYLTHAISQGFGFSDGDLAAVVTKTSPSSTDLNVGWYQVNNNAGVWSLTPVSGPGNVTLPTIANHVAVYTNTTGGLGEDAANAINDGNFIAGVAGSAGTFISLPSTAANGSLILKAINAGAAFDTTISNSAMGQSSVVSIPDPGAATANFIISALTGAGTQHITSGALQVDAGVISSGLATGGTAGGFIAYPATTTNGSLRFTPVGNAGNFAASISNVSTLGQASVYTIPDPGAATANFLLDTGAANILAMQQFVGLKNILAFSAGTWTTTRIAQGNYVTRHTAAADTTIIGIDITPIIRAAAAKGFRLNSMDVIYSIGTLALNAHTMTLDRIAYANNVAVSVTSIALTGALATATQANPYLTNITVTTPAFDVTADSKYVMELTVNAAATSAYDFYGVMLQFSQTIG